jgi:hypothetical protein
MTNRCHVVFWAVLIPAVILGWVGLACGWGQ